MAGYAKDAIDIHEQFPLFPVTNTQAIAGQLGIPHPRYPRARPSLSLRQIFCLRSILLKNSREISVNYEGEHIESRESRICLLLRQTNSLDEAAYRGSDVINITEGLFNTIGRVPPFGQIHPMPMFDHKVVIARVVKITA
jgi:hypothetical protein